jgi:serine/threonine protein kinase
MGTVLDFYQEYHNSELEKYEFPSVITKRYDIKACLKMSDEKQVFLITSKTNWSKYILKAVAKHNYEKLEEEYGLYTSLSHPDIIKAYEYIQGDKYNYLIREYVEGNTITELLEMTQNQHLSDQLLRQITIQICDILQYLHSQKPAIIHRDIKPDNIIITKQGECKLIDFGISRRLHGESEADTVAMGTQFVAPPEQYGFAQTDARSDIYSLGVLMFYMATGNLDIRKSKQYQISGDIWRIIKGCTKFSPKERYLSVQTVKNKLIGYSYLYRWRRFLLAGMIAFAMLLIGLTAIFIINSKGMSETTAQEAASPDLSLVASDVHKNDTLLSSVQEEVTGSNSAKLKSEEIISEEETLSSKELEILPDISEEPATEQVTAYKPSNSQLAEKKTTAAVVEPDAEKEIPPTQGVEQKPTIAPATEQEYIFQSPLIEEAVRTNLGKSSSATITYGDLNQITSLFICGQLVYSRWEEHFVYGVNQYMIGSEYNRSKKYSENGGITTLEDISYMPNLEKLALYNQKISNLQPLKSLHYLSYLGLGSNNISDLEPLLSLTTLNMLDISNNPIMNDDLEALNGLPYLWGLDLGATKITSIFGIREMPLHFLSLFECKVGDCIGLDEITTLDNLILTGLNNAITEKGLDKLQALTNLRILKIFGSESFDLSRLSTLKSLYLLDLCGMWNEVDYSKLNLPALQQLYIDFQSKLILSGLENIPGVTEISLRDSVCADYRPLLKVSGLRKVYCSQAQAVTIKEQLGEVPFELITH